MKIIKEKFKHDIRRGYYWGRIYFISDNRAYKARVLWGLTYEYVKNETGREKIEKKDIERITNDIVSKWKEEKNRIFKPSFRYDPYVADVAKKNELLAFLRENDKV